MITQVVANSEVDDTYWKHIYVPAGSILSIGTFVVFFSSFELAVAAEAFTREFYVMWLCGGSRN